MKIKSLFIMLVIISSLTIIIFISFDYYSNLNEETEIKEIPILDNSPDIPEEINNEADETIFETEEMPMLEMIDQEEKLSNLEGNCGFNFSKNYPLVKSENTDLAVNLNQKISEIFQAQLFNNDNFSEEDCDGESTEELSYQILTNNNKVLSIEKESYSYYAGAAHPNGYSTYHHFKIDDLDEILFTDLFNAAALQGEMLETLSLLILQKLNIIYSDFANDWWIDNPSEIINENTQFYILDQKLFIHFNPYDIAAYAMGPIEINFDFTELNDFLNIEILNLWQ